MSFFRRWVLGWLLLCVSALTQAENLIVSRAYLEDPSAALTVADVQDKSFTPLLQAMLSRGFSKSAFWIRFDVQPRPQGGPVRLRILPGQLDDVRLYAPSGPGAAGTWSESVSGDTQPYDSSDRDLHTLGFWLTPHAPHTTYYLRVVTHGSMLVDIQALSHADARRKDAVLGLLQTVYLAFMGFVLIWAARIFLHQGDRLTGFFVAHQLVSVVMSLAILGYLSPWESRAHPGLINDFTSFSALLHGVLAVVFHRQLFGMLSVPRILLRGLESTALVFALCMLLYAGGWLHEALHLNALAHLVLAGLLCALAFTASTQTMLDLRVVRVNYALLSLSMGAFLVTALGWVGGGRLVMLNVLLYFMLSAGLMLHLLTTRARRLAAEADHKLEAGQRAMQQLALEKQYATEQERFTDMLTHELKTPMGVALMSLGALKSDSPYLARIRQALLTMNGIVDRTRLAELVRNKRLPVHMETVNVSERVYECIEASTEPERVKASVGFELEARTDSQLLGTIVANLIDNALKYSSSWEPVHLSLQRSDVLTRPSLVLQVRNAIGVAGAPDPEQVFAKYYRSAGAQSKTGSGLGLHLCQHLAQMMGASLSYRVVDKAVEFELCLPVNAS